MTTIPDPVAGFSSTYAQARERFLDAARRRGLAVASHVHPHLRGAQDEELAIDVATLGPDKAASVLMLISGTHGAEGFCGSGCQVNLLRDDAFAAEAAHSGVRVVFLHNSTYDFNDDVIPLGAGYLAALAEAALALRP